MLPPGYSSTLRSPKVALPTVPNSGDTGHTQTKVCKCITHPQISSGTGFLEHLAHDLFSCISSSQLARLSQMLASATNDFFLFFSDTYQFKNFLSWKFFQPFLSSFRNRFGGFSDEPGNCVITRFQSSSRTKQMPIFITVK